MNNIHQFPEPDRINDEASTWLAKMDRGLSAEEQLTLKNWLAESKEHREVLFKMAEIWDKMDSLSRLQDLFPHVSGQSKFDQRVGFALAASLVLGIGILIVLLYSDISILPGQSESVASETRAIENFDRSYETSIGEYSSAVLPDGTTVVLNTNSLIQTRYTEEERYIVLQRGEAHFDVTEDKARPLIVKAKDKFIRVVGTVFNVEIGKKDAVELTVTEGKVIVIDVASNSVGEDPNIPIRLSQDSSVVSEGEAAILDSAEIRIRKIEPEEVATNLSWQEGNLIFEGETLEEAIREISRYTSVEFEILDEKIKAIRVVGLFKAGDINGLLITLSENFHIPYRRVGTERVLLGAR